MAHEDGEVYQGKLTLKPSILRSTSWPTVHQTPFPYDLMKSSLNDVKSNMPHGRRTDMLHASDQHGGESLTINLTIIADCMNYGHAVDLTRSALAGVAVFRSTSCPLLGPYHPGATHFTECAVIYSQVSRRNSSVASTNNSNVLASREECPALGTTCSLDSGHCLCRSHAVLNCRRCSGQRRCAWAGQGEWLTGQTMSYRP
jgi:hypothetical protein